MNGYIDETMNNVKKKTNANPFTFFSWHSMKCTCVSCLEADAYAYLSGYAAYNLDTSAIDERRRDDRNGKA